MKKLFSAQNITDAYLVQSLLAEANIKTHILNEYAQGGIGELPFTQAYPEIWIIEPSQYERAQDIVKAYEQRDRDIKTIVCPNCSEPNPDTFEVCWRCKADLNSTAKSSAPA